MKSLYDALKDAGCTLDNHESDLYVKDTPVAELVLKKYEYLGPMSSGREPIRLFRSPVDGAMWWNIPFMFQPFWDQKLAEGQR